MVVPIYEYRCNSCRRRVSIFVQGFPESFSPACTHCGSKELTRLFSSFTMGKAEWYKRKGVYEDILSDSRLTRGMMANDPQALAEWNRRMTRAMEEKPSPESEEITHRLEHGEPVDEVMARMREGEGAEAE